MTLKLKGTEITLYMKGAFPPQRPALYVKVGLIFLTLLFKAVRNFSVKSGGLRRKIPCFLKNKGFPQQGNLLWKNLFFYLISERFGINASFDFGSSHINNENENCILCFWLNGFLIVLIGRF